MNIIVSKEGSKLDIPADYPSGYLTYLLLGGEEINPDKYYFSSNVFHVSSEYLGRTVRLLIYKDLFNIVSVSSPSNLSEFLKNINEMIRTWYGNQNNF